MDTLTGYHYLWQEGEGIKYQIDRKIITHETISKWWKASDIISIELNHNKKVVVFYLNDKRYAQISLQTDIDYYLIITANGKFEYKLMS